MTESQPKTKVADGLRREEHATVAADGLADAVVADEPRQDGSYTSSPCGRLPIDRSLGPHRKVLPRRLASRNRAFESCNPSARRGSKRRRTKRQEPEPADGPPPSAAGKGLARHALGSAPVEAGVGRRECRRLRIGAVCESSPSSACSCFFRGSLQAHRRARGPSTPARPSPIPWEIPEVASARRNPLSASEDTLRVGHALWRRHCEDCHGAEGRGDGPDARLHEKRKHHAPRNLTDPNVQENLTDGDIFWRISRGIIEEDNNVIMPAFEKKVPSEADRWHLVLFVRELGRARR